ncbi:TPA: hypothetical protein RZK55_001734, partial [Campylobacter jejuni]|nr:hypothetical protein [Campylobacter jejuni]
GTIKSNGSQGVNIGGGTSIGNFTNETNGVISSIFSYDGNINTLDNKGTINQGISFVGVYVDTFTNSGTLQETSQKSWSGQAVISVQASGRYGTIKTFTNEGLIKSENANGIALEAGNKIETFINKGTIEAKDNGLSFYYFSGSNSIDIGKITIGDSGIIKAGNDAIHIDGSKADINVQDIDI